MRWWWRVTFCTICKKYLWSGYRIWQHLFYCKNIGWIIDWSDVCKIVWNNLIQVGVIWIDVNRVGIFVISNYRIFTPKMFNIKTIFALRIFENVVDSKVLAFTFCCAMPWKSPLGEIRLPADVVKDVEDPHTVSIWDFGSNGSLWFHPSAVINILPGSSY